MELTRDEINRYIHTEIVRKCWHDKIVDDGYTVRCNDPFRKIEHPSPKGNHYFLNDREDYCSEDAPRSLLTEVLRALRHVLYIDDILIECLIGTGNPRLTGGVYTLRETRNAVYSDAEKLARACVAAHQRYKNGK